MGGGGMVGWWGGGVVGWWVVSGSEKGVQN